MIRIPIKDGDIDAAIDKFKAAKKEQDKAFNERLANILTPQQQKQQTQQRPQGSPAPSYQSILARSRRMG